MIGAADLDRPIVEFVTFFLIFLPLTSPLSRIKLLYSSSPCPTSISPKTPDLSGLFLCDKPCCRALSSFPHTAQLSCRRIVHLLWPLSGNWTCRCRTYVFLWTFIFLIFFAISFYVPLANWFSNHSFPYLLITRDTQDGGEARFDSTDTGNSLKVILWLKNLSRFSNWLVAPLVGLYQSLHSNSASTTSMSPSISTTRASSILSTPTAPKKALLSRWCILYYHMDYSNLT